MDINKLTNALKNNADWLIAPPYLAIIPSYDTDQSPIASTADVLSDIIGVFGSFILKIKCCLCRIK